MNQQEESLWKKQKRVELEDLYREMDDFSVSWHLDKKCDCMKNCLVDITRDNFLPCEHLTKALLKEFNKKIKKIDFEIQEAMCLKLASSLSN